MRDENEYVATRVTGGQRPGKTRVERLRIDPHDSRGVLLEHLNRLVRGSRIHGDDFDTVFGLLFGKLLAVVTRGKINPLVGAAGISAFPMSGRLVQKIAQEEDFTNHVLMHAMGANTAGQLGSVIAGGILLALVTAYLAK